tara:strand:- start:26 stop:598 length:573 start_codon:yes stop_codon:yes gene_type:complete
MSNIDFVNLHRYQAIEQIVYQNVKNLKPNIIVELGHGSGALTVSMGLALKEINNKGKIYSYDKIGDSPYELNGIKSNSRKNIENRNLTSIVNFIGGDIFSTWVSKPFTFDLLLIDIDNTWETLYKILINNKFINNEIKKGSKVLIEGGDQNHPRINQKTLDSFNSKFQEPIFKLKYLAGSGRTSLSILEL